MEHRTEELIELYFSNSLTETDSQELKNILAADPEAAAEFEWQLGLAKQVSKLPLAKGIQNDQWREAAKPRFRKVTLWRNVSSIAAAILMLLAATYFLPKLFSSDESDMVVASAAHFPNKMKFKSLGGNEEAVGPEVLDAFAAYDQKNYAEASTKLTTVVAANPERMDYRFYLGVAQIATKQYPEAIITLIPVAESSGHNYSTVAGYYLGVGYAGVRDVPKAQLYLEKYIAADDGVTFREQATRLLEAL